MKTYSVEIKSSGIIQQHIMVKAPNAETAIDNIIGGLEVPPCNEYAATEIKDEDLLFDFQKDLISWALQKERMAVLF